jgi:pimeloyl-ACP methyl ester carboxylesterase
VALLEVAAAGYTVFVPKMPLNFAVLGSQAARAIIDSHPAITAWALAGHSLGGAMACSYATGDPRVRVLIFWAAYCDKSFDLSGDPSIAVTSISAALDGLATPAKVDSTKQYAPPSTVYVSIAGMNHAQFGDYGAQSGDNPATLSPSVATRRVVAATLKALEQLEAK